MARKIPKNTEFFEYKNENPRGLHRSDCVVRALSSALNLSWEETFTLLCEEGLKRKLMPNDNLVFEAILEKNGWIRRISLRNSDNRRVTGVQFLKLVKQPAVISIGTHHLSYSNGKKIQDIFDCSDRSVGRYWVKEN